MLAFDCTPGTRPWGATTGQPGLILGFAGTLVQTPGRVNPVSLCGDVLMPGGCGGYRLDMVDRKDVGPPRAEDHADTDEGQVSEASAMPRPESAGDPITPGDPTAGYPFEGGRVGTAGRGDRWGPDAAPRHGRTEPSNESSR